MANKKTDPWKELASLRERKKKLVTELTKLEGQETILRSECYTWLGNTSNKLLSRRQLEVLLLIQNNPTFCNKELASRLHVCERTVKFHISSLLLKFGVQSKTELMYCLPKVPQENSK